MDDNTNKTTIETTAVSVSAFQAQLQKIAQQLKKENYSVETVNTIKKPIAQENKGFTAPKPKM